MGIDLHLVEYMSLYLEIQQHRDGVWTLTAQRLGAKPKSKPGIFRRGVPISRVSGLAARV